MTKPMNFLFTTWEGGGNVTPAIEVARKLVKRGHRVRFMSEECNRREAEAIGAEFIAWKRALNRKDRTRHSQTLQDWKAATPQEGLISVINGICCGPALTYAHDVIDELKREPADLVATSDLLVGVMAGCESIGQLFVNLCPNISLPPLPGIPPMGPGLAPAKTEEERALYAEMTKGLYALFDVGLPALNEARKALGLGPLEHVFDQFKAARAELLATSKAFDFPSDALPDRVRYVGPQISDPNWAQPWTSPWSESDQRPLVTVGFSTTFQNHRQVLQNIIDALAPLPARVLVTLGGSIELGELRTADNCVIVESAPHTVVMREAALVVTHGGHGTIMRALTNRVPTLVIPHGRDQNDNAVRIRERGAGLSLMPDAAIEDIRAACRRLLNEPQFKTEAIRLGDLVAAEVEQSTVVEELEAAATANASSATKLDAMTRCLS